MRPGRILIPALLGFVARAQHSELTFHAPRLIYLVLTLAAVITASDAVRFSPAAETPGITKVEIRPASWPPRTAEHFLEEVWSVIQRYSTILTAKQ